MKNIIYSLSTTNIAFFEDKTRQAPVAQMDRVLGFEPLKKPLKTPTVKHSC